MCDPVLKNIDRDTGWRQRDIQHFIDNVGLVPYGEDMIKKLVELGVVALILYLIFIALQYIVAALALPGVVVTIGGVLLLLVFIHQCLVRFGIDI